MKITFDFLEEQGFEGVCDYCRFLIKNANYPLDDKIEVYRGDMLCLTVTDIYAASKLTVKESPTPHFDEYKEMSVKAKAALSLNRRNKPYTSGRTFV